MISCVGHWFGFRDVLPAVVFGLCACFCWLLAVAYVGCWLLLPLAVWLLVPCNAGCWFHWLLVVVCWSLVVVVAGYLLSVVGSIRGWQLVGSICRWLLVPSIVGCNPLIPLVVGSWCCWLLAVGSVVIGCWLQWLIAAY